MDFSRVKKIKIPEGYVNTLKILGTTVWEGVKNLLPSSVDTDGSIFNNGLGYIDGKYLSSSGWHNVSTDAACVTTGYVPIAVKSNGTLPEIYIKGVTFDTSESHVRFAIYGSDFSVINGAGSSYAWSFLTATKLAESYYKLTFITNYASTNYFRFSCIGSGENLIITVDEPIE